MGARSLLNKEKATMRVAGEQIAELKFLLSQVEKVKENPAPEEE